MKRFFKLLLLLLISTIIISAAWYYKKLKPAGSAAVVTTTKPVSHNLTQYAKKAKAYAQQKGYNTSVCFLIDMRVASGSNRFYVYNLKTDSIDAAALVTHGRCNKNWLQGRQYGNKVGCGCTSLGRYKIGAAYQGRFGLAYKLHGLDSSNSNAFKRYVVLHSHNCVPAQEVDPYPICQSDGCPTVAPGFLKTLAKIIDASQQPILLWIYE